MLAGKFSHSSFFVQCLFGCQHHGQILDEERTALIEQFLILLQSSATHTDKLEQEDSRTPGFSSTIFVAYWQQETEYRKWWRSEPVKQFWNSLPDNAGFWREKLAFPASRVLAETNHHIKNGFSHVADFEPLVEKTGYWGSYRDRIEESTSDDKLSSPFELAVPTEEHRPRISLGRTMIEKFPDNICFVVEGQDYGSMDSTEQDYWFENLENLCDDWVMTTITTGHKDGILSARLCHETASGPIKPTATKNTVLKPKALTLNRRVQYFYFLDMSYMERIGRKYKTHVTLRRKFMEVYGPGGPMEGGKLILWVDLGILKGHNMEAEYVGCFEGTGFLAYRDHPGFTTKVDFEEV
ncbi:uncharacterized protein N7511_004844 [Penicillium nucicola]|uniref:uncharacterized protein n=1 Tax=Penicillium nucicola TaxID=1850975 RepID=UPI002544EF9F|nr:uncharacterized protein N7511_004844 [Penicillium nucicola]KAJ5767228.1 hypothetical protein N7511_004844 [Penicillium nucicola]